MSLVSTTYHIVFCTKNRAPVLVKDHREELYRFIWKALGKNKCILYRIGGIENHIHMLISLSPTVALSDLMRELKSTSSGWLKSNPNFPKFSGWASEYYASTLAYKDKEPVIKYINNQESHHHTTDFDAELKRLCKVNGIQMYDDMMS